MIISPEAFQYLYIQRGEVSDAYLMGGFNAWKEAYEYSLKSIMRNIEPVLPGIENVRILDIGGGLGGIGVLLTQRLKNSCYAIIDGMMDDPEVIRHDQTFSNHVVARKFLHDNGVDCFAFYSTASSSQDLRKFDLITSFAAWGFHIAPSVYLPRVLNSLADNAVLVLDVRKDKRDWMAELVYALGEPQHTLEEGKKHVRLAWET